MALQQCANDVCCPYIVICETVIDQCTTRTSGNIACIAHVACSSSYRFENEGLLKVTASHVHC